MFTKWHFLGYLNAKIFHPGKAGNMLKNYFRTSLRNLKRNKVYTAINILGLAMGISICLIIFLLIGFETSFDNFHKKEGRIYRVLTEYHHSDSKNIFYGRGVPFAAPRDIRSNFKELEAVAPVYNDNDVQLLAYPGEGSSPKKFKEGQGVFYTSPSFFDMFDFPLLAGSYQSLKDPGNALLTRDIAEKYFGNWKQAIGKTIRVNNSSTIKVTGILANVPDNTGFPLKVVIAYGTGFTREFLYSTNWDGTGSANGCFILMPPQVSARDFNQRLIAYSKKMKSPDNKDLQTIQPLRDIHFDTAAGDFGGKTISHKLINALWLMAAFILLIACVNFINLSTAQAVNRSKEVGVRKVLGSNRWQLKVQFLTETFVIVLASVVVAFGLAILALPYVNHLLDLSIKITEKNMAPLILFLSGVTVFVTGLAGFYPSVVLSRFNPIHALQSKRTASISKGFTLRKGLVVFQFIIAQSLIIATLIIAKQMAFFISQPLGFDKSATVNVPVPTDSISLGKIDFLRKELQSVHGIENVSFNSNTPVEDNNDSWTNIKFDHAQKQTDFYSIFKIADDQYLPGFKLPLVAGRNLAPSDTVREFLVNEMLLKNLGITDPNKALQKQIYIYDHAVGPIVGVLKDFHTRSFRDDLAPLVITSDKKYYSEASIKLDSKTISSSIATIEKKWNEVFPDFVFEYKFMDEKVESFYKQENQLGHLYKIFAFIAIFLSCLGLYGLASFMAVQRIKEVGIRKVLGATGSSIVYLFSKEFIMLITIAFLIATPLTYYFMHQWLQNYPFRIDLTAWIFLAGGLASIIIALTTVSFQAVKASLANPVMSLRSE
jgi:putative ABC transport system permease protein